MLCSLDICLYGAHLSCITEVSMPDGSSGQEGRTHVDHASRRSTVAQPLLTASLRAASLLAGRLDEASTQEHKAREPQAWVHRRLSAIHSYRESPEVEPAATHERQALARAVERSM